MATSYDGVPGDIDMEMEEHLIELAKRFLLVFAIIGVVTLVSYPVTDNIIGVLKAKFVPPGINVITINPVEIVFTRLKIAVVISLLAGAPLIVYETFAFMRPGLYPSEKRFFISVVPASLVLFIIGAALSYTFLIAPLSARLIATATETTTPMLILSQLIDYVIFLFVVVGVISKG
jgi:sec-independent protein translocase protein TatC